MQQGCSGTTYRLVTSSPLLSRLHFPVARRVHLAGFAILSRNGASGCPASSFAARKAFRITISSLCPKPNDGSRKQPDLPASVMMKSPLPVCGVASLYGLPSVVILAHELSGYVLRNSSKPFSGEGALAAILLNSAMIRSSALRASGSSAPRLRVDPTALDVGSVSVPGWDSTNPPVDSPTSSRLPTVPVECPESLSAAGVSRPVWGSEPWTSEVGLLGSAASRAGSRLPP